MSETAPGQVGSEAVEPGSEGARQEDEPMVADPSRAGVTEQTGSTGTGTVGSSNVAGQIAQEERGEEMREDYAGALQDGPTEGADDPEAPARVSHAGAARVANG